MNQIKENDKKIEIKDINIKISWSAKKGSIITVMKLAKESGLEQYYMSLVNEKDEKEKEKKIGDLYRHVYTIISMLELSGIIQFIGTDRFQRNGIRGKPPKVYRVKKDVHFEWWTG